MISLANHPSSADRAASASQRAARSEEHTSELQSRQYLVCRLLFEKDPTTTEICPLSLHGALPEKGLRSPPASWRSRRAVRATARRRRDARAEVEADEVVRMAND